MKNYLIIIFALLISSCSTSVSEKINIKKAFIQSYKLDFVDGNKITLCFDRKMDSSEELTYHFQITTTKAKETAFCMKLSNEKESECVEFSFPNTSQMITPECTDVGGLQYNLDLFNELKNNTDTVKILQVWADNMKTGEQISNQRFLYGDPLISKSDSPNK